MCRSQTMPVATPRSGGAGRVCAMSSPVHGRLADAEAAPVAGVAARQHGIKAPIEPLRAGANHVFRAGEAVVRVAPLLS